MNNARGYLAEYLVARAVGSTEPRRIEWGAQDVISPDGTRIEVKATGYLQSWSQTKPSTPTFSLTGAKSTWDETTATWTAGSDGRVHVWVFALHTCRDHELYNPLAVEQWTFWTVPDAAIATLGQKRAGLSTIERLAGGAASYSDLPALVTAAAEQHRRTRDTARLERAAD